MNKVHCYRYTGELLERMKLHNFGRAVPTVRVKIGKGLTEAHATFKEKRRDVKEVDAEIKSAEKELQEMEKRQALNRRERERVDFLEGHVQVLNAEKNYTGSMEYLGQGEVIIGDGMHQQVEEDIEPL
jgi:Skp family chaperone for outer membrane proteins